MALTTQPKTTSHRGKTTGPMPLARRTGVHAKDAESHWPRVWAWVLAVLIGLFGAGLLFYSLYAMVGSTSEPAPRPAPPPTAVSCELEPSVVMVTHAHRAMP